MSGPPPTRDVRLGRGAFAVVLVVIGVGVLYLGVAPQHWLRGVLVVGGGLLLGGVARAVVPDARAGPLAVRGRVFDVACYVLAGLAVAGFGLVLG